MDKEDFENFIEGRYIPELDHTEERIIYHQKRFKRLQAMTIILSTLTTILLVMEQFLGWHLMKLAALICSAIVALIAGFQQSFGHQKKWTFYDKKREQLAFEFDMYRADLDAYADIEDKEKMFVSRISNLISAREGAPLTGMRGYSRRFSTSYTSPLNLRRNSNKEQLRHTKEELPQPEPIATSPNFSSTSMVSNKPAESLTHVEAPSFIKQRIISNQKIRQEEIISNGKTSKDGINVWQAPSIDSKQTIAPSEQIKLEQPPLSSLDTTVDGPSKISLNNAISWRSFAEKHGIPQATVRRAITANRLTIVKIEKKTVRKYSLDRKGQTQFYLLYCKHPKFHDCDGCPHL